MNRDGGKSPPISPNRTSIGSDGGGFPLRSPTAASLPPVKPAPAYISQAAASDYVTSLQRERQEHRETPELRDATEAIFSETSLALVNGFIDHLLYQFLATARSTSLPALRPAVEQILKAKLARQAFANADEELHDLLGDDEDFEDDDNSSVQSSEDPRVKWDLDAVWKMTRLKVMVYTSTSDLEEDEEEQLSAEHMSPSQHRQSRYFGLVSWTTSIFLTSILEFVGEQCLSIAGQAAYDRSSVKRKSKLSTPETPDGQGVVVDEYDAERIALNASLGRLWRTWRKSLRSTRSFIHSSPTSSRRPSLITNHSPQASKSGDETRNESQLDPAVTSEPIQEQDTEERRERNTKAFEEFQSKLETSDEANVLRPDFHRTRSRSIGTLPTVMSLGEQDVVNVLVRPPMPRKRSSSQPNPLRSNPPDIFYDEEEPVPDVTQSGAKEALEPVANGEEEHGEEDRNANEVEQQRSRSITPFEGESEYAADSERPNTTFSNYTNTSISERVAETVQAHEVEPASGQVQEPQATKESTLATINDGSTQALRSSKRVVSNQEEEPEEDMEAAEAAAALNSLPPNLAKREMPVDVALASAVPGAFPAISETRYEPPTQLQTVEEDQEFLEETPDSSKQAMLDVRDISRGEKINAVSASSIAFPSNPSSIYDDAPQERQSLEMSEEPVTPPKDPPKRESAQSNSPAISKTPAYTGTTVTILSNSADLRERQSSTQTPTQATTPPSSHTKSSSRASDIDPRQQTVRSPKPIVTPSVEDNETMERNFEGLMASSQTKKYTLTPQNLRAIETDPNSPDGASTAQPVVRQRGAQKFNVMAVSERQDEIDPPPPPPKKVGPSWSVKYGNLNQNNNRPSRAGLLAREPRVQQDSMREFADFIRSTAPDSRPGPGGHTVPILVPSNPAASAAIGASAKSSRPSLENGGSRQAQRVAPSPTTPGSMNRNPRSNLSAREASTPRSNVNADLIDFLNSGPPSAPSTPGLSSSRVSGRNGTRSSDNLKTSNSSADYRAGSTMAPSVHDSLNSHSPLVQSSQMPRSQAPPGSAPARKQHRVKDPYALPSDDEEEDEDDFPMPPPKPRGTNQESLMDFLNNYDPPGSNKGPPTVPSKAQKMLGGNARVPKAAPPIAPHGSNDSSQVSLEASALPEFLRSEPQKAYNYPDSYTTTTIESLSSQQSKPKRSFWRKNSS